MIICLTSFKGQNTENVAKDIEEIFGILLNMIYIPIIVIGLIQAYFTISVIYQAGIFRKSIKPLLKIFWS